MKKILNPYLNKEGYNCVCCAPNNPVGLHLEFWEDGEDILTIWNPGENYQGWINTLHGGIISMLMDEVAGWVINRKLQTTGVTMQLNVKYKKPVMTTESQITVRGHIASQRRPVQHPADSVYARNHRLRCHRLERQHHVRPDGCALRGRMLVHQALREAA